MSRRCDWTACEYLVDEEHALVIKGGRDVGSSTSARTWLLGRAAEYLGGLGGGSFSQECLQHSRRSAGGWDGWPVFSMSTRFFFL